MIQSICLPTLNTLGFVALTAQKTRGDSYTIPANLGEGEEETRIVEHIRNRVNEDPKPSTEAAEFWPNSYIETTPFVATSCGGGGFLFALRRGGWGGRGSWVQKVVSWASF